MNLFRKRLLKYDLVQREQNYLWYALGEITLIVLGILIALGINSTYDDYTDRKVEKEILNKLLYDIESDFEYISELESFYSKHLGEIEYAKKIFLNDQNDSLVNLIAKGYNGAAIQDINPRRTTFDEMINSGKLYNLSSNSLTNLCIDYYKLFENNIYSLRQNRIEYRKVLYSPQMSDFWLLYLELEELRELKEINLKELDLLKAFVENKHSTAFKTLKQSTYWGVILIQKNFERLQNIKSMNRKLKDIVQSEV